MQLECLAQDGDRCWALVNAVMNFLYIELVT